jgi:hypothetical protein
MHLKFISEFRGKEREGKKKKKDKTSRVSVAHTSNPSYLGDRNQEDLGSKLAWPNYYSYTHSSAGLLTEMFWLWLFS